MPFQPTRLRLARALHGLTQEELGDHVAVTRQFIHKLETEPTGVSDEVLNAIADVLGFEPPFFFEPVTVEVRDDDCHFRKRRTTPLHLRNRVVSRGTLFAALVSYLDKLVQFPRVNIPEMAASSPEGVECAAEHARTVWGIPADAPLINVTRVIENAGGVVTTFGGISDTIDAFSWFGQRPIVVRSTDKGSPSRSRFDLAHEIGHILLHRGLTTGDHATEEQATRFGAAFLLPRAAFIAEFPRRARLDWTAIFGLKKRWRVSVAAIVRRAYDLGIINAIQYRRANVHITQSGWRKREPLEPEHSEAPEALSLAFEALRNGMRLKPWEVAAALHWRPEVLAEIAGISVEPPLPEEGNVVNLDARRHAGV